MEAGIVEIIDRLCIDMHNTVAEASSFSKARQYLSRTDMVLQMSFLDIIGIANRTYQVKFM